MKINICYTNLNALEDYVNISPFAQPNSPFTPLDIRNLDEVACDDEVEEILALQILNYFPLEEVFKSTQNWIKKLKSGGHLILTFNDSWEVARRIFIGIIENKEANEVLYGKQDKPYEVFRSAIPLHELKNHLLSCGTKLVKCRLEGFITTLEVEKV